MDVNRAVGSGCRNAGMVKSIACWRNLNHKMGERGTEQKEKRRDCNIRYNKI